MLWRLRTLIAKCREGSKKQNQLPGVNGFEYFGGEQPATAAFSYCTAKLKAEQLDGVAAGYLQPVSGADGSAIEPVGGPDHIFIGVIHGIENAVSADFTHHIVQSRGAKHAAGGDVKVLTKILAQGALGLDLKTEPGNSIVSAPNGEGQTFAHMAENDLELGHFIEQAAGHQAQGVIGRFHRESPGRAGQPGITFVIPLACGQRWARVKIKGDVELLNGSPEGPVLRQVVEHRRIGLPDLRETVDQ